MNRFSIISCVNLEKGENGYCGPAIALGCVTDPSLVLFFPVSPEKADILNYLIKDGEYGINTEVIGLYKTMIDSWSYSNQFLSGIILDCEYEKELQDDIMYVTLSLSNSVSGLLESVVNVNFVNSIILAAIQDIEVIVTMKLLNKLLPEEDEVEDEEVENNIKHNPIDPKVVINNGKFPEDSKILDIVRGIMESSNKNEVKDVNSTDKPSDEIKKTKSPKSPKSINRKNEENNEGKDRMDNGPNL